MPSGWCRESIRRRISISARRSRSSCLRRTARRSRRRRRLACCTASDAHTRWWGACATTYASRRSRVSSEYLAGKMTDTTISSWEFRRKVSRILQGSRMLKTSNNCAVCLSILIDFIINVVVVIIRPLCAQNNTVWKRTQDRLGSQW